jgi:hypothetical protein
LSLYRACDVGVNMLNSLILRRNLRRSGDRTSEEYFRVGFCLTWREERAGTEASATDALWMPLRGRCRGARVGAHKRGAITRAAGAGRWMRRDGRAGAAVGNPPAFIFGAHRRGHCRQTRRLEMALAQRCDRIAQMVREELSGLFRESAEETGYSQRGPMASLYFLVERSRLHAFRAAFGSIASAQAALMLSGPWPPYNFVCGAIAGGNELDPIRALR